MDDNSPEKSVFRIDKFVVPAASRDEFLPALHEMQRFLREQPGCVQNLVLEQFSGAGSFNFATVAEWQDQSAFAAAGAAIARWRQSTGFDTASLMRRLGVEPDMGNYRVLGD